MPTLHNPTENKLFCHLLERILAPFEHVEISDEQAEALKDNAIFAIFADKSAAEDAGDKAHDDETESAAPKAQRKTATRGSKQAEVNAEPERETRG